MKNKVKNVFVNHTAFIFEEVDLPYVKFVSYVTTFKFPLNVNSSV